MLLTPKHRLLTPTVSSDEFRDETAGIQPLVSNPSPVGPNWELW
jgi:hypothetical protein